MAITYTSGSMPTDVTIYLELDVENVGDKLTFVTIANWIRDELEINNTIAEERLRATYTSGLDAFKKIRVELSRDDIKHVKDGVIFKNTGSFFFSVRISPKITIVRGGETSAVVKYALYNANSDLGPSTGSAHPDYACIAEQLRAGPLKTFLSQTYADAQTMTDAIDDSGLITCYGPTPWENDYYPGGALYWAGDVDGTAVFLPGAYAQTGYNASYTPGDDSVYPRNGVLMFDLGHSITR